MDIKKFNQGFLFFSNRIESLFDSLKENLFQPDQNVFSERFLIFPSREMEKWVKFRLAEENGIASGIQAFFLNQAIDMLAHKFFLVNKPFFIPGELELTLKIDEVLSKSDLLNDERFHPLKKIVNGKEKRRILCARQLAFLFQRYGIYGGGLCREWEKNPKEWQELVWQKVFEEWTYPLKTYPQLEIDETREEASFHLFSFSHLSPLHFDFFRKVSQKHKVFIYQLSPCLEFWSDFPSKRSFTKIDEDYLLSVHPILAFAGKVGQHQARMIEDAEGLFVFEDYHNNVGHSALQILQENLLLLNQEPLPEDDSIQIHVSKSELREIESLYQFILREMDEKGLEPKDFLVLAPDISIYEPHIRAIFDDPEIADVQALHQNKLTQGIFFLLDLDNKRWSASALLQLFDHPLFCQKLGWVKEDILLIQDWIQKTGIRWGLDKEHRDFLLKESFCEKDLQDEKGTWKSGIELLLENLSVDDEKKWIDFTEAKLLGDVAKVLEDLYKDLQAAKREKTLKEWCAYFSRLSQTYFALSEDNAFFEEKLNRFLKASSHFPLVKYSFQTIHYLLQEWVGKSPLTLSSKQLSSVSFCSILPMRAIPAQVICLIGLNENAFPRKEVFRNLDLLKKQKGGDFAPTRTDFDRYLFIEAILSARSTLFLSYLDNEHPPSTLITELKRQFVQKKEIIHPVKSYDPTYFDGQNSHLKSYSEEDYRLAQRFRNKEKGSPFFIKSSIPSLKGEHILDISELNKLIRCPLKVYFEKKMGCPFIEEKEVEDEEAFILSPLQKSSLRKLSFKETSSHILEKGEKERDFPLGFFGKLARDNLTEEIALLKKNLKDVSPLTCELVLGEKRSFFDETGIWRTPALEVKLESQATIFLVGKLEGLFERGLLSFNSCTFENAIKLLPSYLVASQIPLPPGYRVEEIFFVKENVEAMRLSEKTKQLSHLLEYYFSASKNPSPLFPEWLEFFLKKDAPALKKKGNWENVRDPLLKWALAGREAPNFGELVDLWRKEAETLFKEVFDGGF